MNKFLLAATLAALMACDGKIGGGSIPMSPVGSDQPDETEGPTGPNVTPLRRLTALEYTRSLTQIFPGVRLPAVTIPSDPRPFGFDNDAQANSPSASLIDAYVDAAQTVAAAASATGSPIYSCSSRDIACAQVIIRSVGRRAYRRPLTDAEVNDLLAFYRAPSPAASDFRAATQLTIEALLQSPDFLYRFDAPLEAMNTTGEQPLDAYSLATRLSFLVTASSPDDALLDAARDGRLTSTEDVEREFERLVNQPTARAGVLHFFHQWFEAEKIDTVRKLDADALDSALRADLVEEFDRTVSGLVFDGSGGTLTDLFSRPVTHVSQRTAALYGLPRPADDGWTRVTLDETKRAGVLTQPLFLASHAHPGNPSPVLRGVFILEKLLCERVPPPPAAAQGIAVTGEGTTGPTTNRMRYVETTERSASCSGCHKPSINPPGFAFENFDTMGRRIETENGLTIDASGTLLDFTFRDGVEFSRQLGGSPKLSACLTQRFARFAMGGDEWLRDAEAMSSLEKHLADSNGNLKSFLRAVVTHPRFRIARFPTVSQ